MDLLQNRGFVRGFWRLSRHVTKCHACHGICISSPLRAAVTMRFAKTCNPTRPKCCTCHAKWNRRCPKCCACHEKMQQIFGKCSKSIAPATQNDFWRVLKHDGMPGSATPATQNDMTTASDTSKKSRFCDFSHRHFAPTTAAVGRLRTVANGCGRSRTVADGCKRLRTVADAKNRVTRTQVNPQTPKCKTRTLHYAFGKKALGFA